MDRIDEAIQRIDRAKQEIYDARVELYKAIQEAYPAAPYGQKQVLAERVSLTTERLRQIAAGEMPKPIDIPNWG